MSDDARQRIPHRPIVMGINALQIEPLVTAGGTRPSGVSSLGVMVSQRVTFPPSHPFPADCGVSVPGHLISRGEIRAYEKMRRPSAVYS